MDNPHGRWSAAVQRDRERTVRSHAGRSNLGSADDRHLCADRGVTGFVDHVPVDDCHARFSSMAPAVTGFWIASLPS